MFFAVQQGLSTPWQAIMNIICDESNIDNVIAQWQDELGKSLNSATRSSSSTGIGQFTMTKRT